MLFHYVCTWRDCLIRLSKHKMCQECLAQCNSWRHVSSIDMRIAICELLTFTVSDLIAACYGKWYCSLNLVCSYMLPYARSQDGFLHVRHFVNILLSESISIYCLRNKIESVCIFKCWNEWIHFFFYFVRYKLVWDSLRLL